MNINNDFSKRVSVHSERLAWSPSPMPGVERRMLDRIGEEVARATTIVRYAPDSSFSSHVHTGGEEFLVLEGVFQDEHGDFPAGSYIRNPPKSKHTPRSELGCVIFVKLWQFQPNDDEHVRIKTQDLEFVPDLERSGVDVKLLFQKNSEQVRLERWGPNQKICLDAMGGLEVLVLGGTFKIDDELFSKQSWLRLPNHATEIARAGNEGALLWIKQGHLHNTPIPPTAS